MKAKMYHGERSRPGAHARTDSPKRAGPRDRHARNASGHPGAHAAEPVVETPHAQEAPVQNGHHVHRLANGEPVNRPPEVVGPTDEQLLGFYLEGDRASFARLIERYQRELFHFLIRFLSDRALAEDIFQETFLQVHTSSASFDRSRRFRPWLFTIAANKARDLLRAQSRRPTNPLQAPISPSDSSSGEFIDLMVSAQAMPHEPLEKEELRQNVQRAVMGMPEHLREIILLSYFHQFPYKQIGEILGIPLGTVKSRLHAAVAFFAATWNSTNRDKALA